MAAVKKFLIKTSRSSAWRQAKKKSSSVTACRPATASIFAKPFHRATPTPAKKLPVTALIAWPKCATSSAEAKRLLEGSQGSAIDCSQSGNACGHQKSPTARFYSSGLGWVAGHSSKQT